MQFVIKNIQANLASYKFKIYKNARLIIKAHTITPGEQKLNQYLIANYNMNLKLACLYLLASCKFYRDYSNNVIILFPKEKDDELASLITYGNNELKGSTLLKRAFFRK